MKKKVKRCIVYGCSNEPDQGGFIGDLCVPCHSFIVYDVAAAYMYGKHSQAARNAIQFTIRHLSEPMK